MRFIAASLLVLLSSTSAPSYAIEVSDKKPTLVISGGIARGNILPIGQKMLDLANSGTKEVQLIINSPGGSVTTGFMFLSSMQAAQQRGMKVTCFVPKVAASMAFQILSHCDERHTLNNAFLLWHRARVVLGGGMFSPGVPLTGPEAMKLGRDLESTDDAILSQLIKALGSDMDVVDIKYHFEAETLHIGLNLHKIAPDFITPHTVIPGLLEALSVEEAKQDKEQNVITMDSFSFGDLVYISPNFSN
jgi:hypothetical protein